MVTANLKVIEEVKYFLNLVLKDPEIRNFFTTGAKDFSRSRKLPLDKIVGMLINLPKRSLSIELQQLFETLGEPNNSCTKAAFSLQRSKLLPIFFKVWNQLLVESFYTHYAKDLKRWEGYRLFAVDGSYINTINVPEVIEHYGTNDNQVAAVPMARLMEIQDVLNDITIWGEICPVKSSENAVIASNIHRLPPDSITLFDRGYPSYRLMYLLENEEIPRHFLMRCKSSFSKEVIQFLKSKKKDSIVTIYPSSESIETLKKHCVRVTKQTGFTVRMMKVKLPDGEVEVLLTNLYESKKYTLKKMCELYFMRWGIETMYDTQKNQMQVEIFSGHRVICIEQDYAASLFVANLQSIIGKQCEEEIEKINLTRVYDYKINRNISLAHLKNRILKLFIGSNDSGKLLMELQTLFLKNLEPIRPDRHLPRPKPKRRHGKYRTFTNYRRAI